MAIKWFAKKINIFCRYPSYITWSDILFTYIYIISILFIITYYIESSYFIALEDLSHCNKHNSKRSCIKSEILHICLTKIGIIFSFSVAIYKFTDLTSSLINCLCCCYSCISQKEDINNSNISIELNSIRNKTNINNINNQKNIPNNKSISV